MPDSTPTGPGARPGGSISRRDLLRMGTILGVLLLPVGCRNGDDGDGDSDDERVDGDGERVDADVRSRVENAGRRSVIVVGAGAAGLSAAHLLAQAGVEVLVLEAGSTHGGRVRDARDVVDFPLSLGAEWLHDDVEVLDELVGRQVDVEVVGYGPEDTLGTYDGTLTSEPLDDDDLKFVGSSWLEVFDTYVVADIADRLQFDTRVVRIDATGEGVTLADERGGSFEADAAIVTVPVTVLRDRDITFVPDLTDDKWAAIDDVEVWGGLKVFVEFAERFYPTFLTFPDSFTTAGQRLYYDAAHGQDRTAHVLGLFAVGAPAEPYQGLDADALRERVLAELDEVFDGAASRSYRRHIVQDWSAEPHIRQAYVADHADSQLVHRLGQPATDRVLFAGDAYTDGRNWSEVHVAADAARIAAERLLASW